MSYIEDTRGTETASKVKDFKISEKLYHIKRVKEINIYEEEPSRATLGEAFHYLVEVGIDKWSERYQVTEKFLKADLIEMIANREISEESKQAKIKELSKSSVKLPALRKEYYGEEKRNDMKNKIELTPAESNMMIRMYEEIYKQPLRDMSGNYTKEKRFQVNYGSLNIGFKPDRICFYIDGEQVEVELIDTLMEGKGKEERKKYIKDHNITCLIRDFKTVGQMDKMIKEFMYDQETSNGYVFSMSFYYSCIYAIYSIESDVYIDAIEKSEPYRTEVISIPRSWMKDTLISQIKPALDKLIICKKTDIRSEPDRKDIVSNKKLSQYYKYFDNSIQKTPTLIDLAL